MAAESTDSSYLIDALGWQISGGHADWLCSGERLAGRDDVRAAYAEIDRLLEPFAQYRITGLLHGEESLTEYTPVEGGTGVRMTVSGLGIAVESFDVCVSEEATLGLVTGCDCTRCVDESSARNFS